MGDPKNADVHVEPTKTWVPLAYIGTAIVLAGWLAWHTSKANSALERVEKVAEKHADHLPRLQSSIDRLSVSFEAFTTELDGAASTKEIRSWVRMLRAQNPEIQVPEFDF